MLELVNQLLQSFKRKSEIVLRPEILSNKMFNCLQRYCPTASDSERNLMDYIVKAELVRIAK